MKDQERQDLQLSQEFSLIGKKDLKMTTYMHVRAHTHTYIHTYNILSDRVQGHQVYRGLTEVSERIFFASLRQVIKKYSKGGKNLQLFIGDVWYSALYCKKVPCVQKLSGISLIICVAQKFKLKILIPCEKLFIRTFSMQLSQQFLYCYNNFTREVNDLPMAIATKRWSQNPRLSLGFQR